VRLVIVTPQSVFVDEDVAHVRAEDDSGAFGILDRHADMLTALTVSVLVYCDRHGNEHFVAVRGGILTVSGRHRIEVLTRDAVRGTSLGQIGDAVLARFRQTSAREEQAQRGARKLESGLLRRVADYLHDPRRPGDARGAR
jgi:F-type H+-transporting ATPase subunit epsilon